MHHRVNTIYIYVNRKSCLNKINIKYISLVIDPLAIKLVIVTIDIESGDQIKHTMIYR